MVALLPDALLGQLSQSAFALINRVRVELDINHDTRSYKIRPEPYEIVGAPISPLATLPSRT